MQSCTSQAACAKCIHYFITYDPQFPYGCRAMGFKSRRPPHQEIIAATGTGCVTFSPKLRAPVAKT